MPVPVVNLNHVAIIAERFEPLGVKFVFIGGSVIALLVDNPKVSSIRPTNDVDVVFEVLTHLEYTKLEERLIALHFKNDTSDGAPRCRWIIEDIKVDVLPARDDHGHWGSRWLEEAINSPTEQRIANRAVNIITPQCFIAAKMEAFVNRGNADFLASRDFEDIITVIDGRAAIVSELFTSNPALTQYVAETATKWLDNPEFQYAIPGQFSDKSGRSEIFLSRFREISALRISG